MDEWLHVLIMKPVYLMGDWLLHRRLSRIQSRQDQHPAGTLDLSRFDLD
jgi:hypothetical protein